MKHNVRTKQVNCCRCSAVLTVSNAAHTDLWLCPGCFPAVVTCTVCGETRPGGDFRKQKRWGGLYLDRRCQECRAKYQRHRQRTPEGRYTASRNIAKQRCLAWELTLEQYVALIAQPCHYCRCPLAETGLGLDRLEDDRGYSVGNVVPCCWECNCAKAQTFSADEMLVIGAAIRKVKLARQKRGERYQRRNGWGRPQKYTTN